MVSNFGTYLTVAPIAALVIGIATCIWKRLAPYTSPVYALVEGALLGIISAVFEARYPGIVLQSVSLTLGTMFTLLLLYMTGWVRASANFRLGVGAATGGICIVYLMSMAGYWFGWEFPFIHESGIMGVGFSLFVVVIAALNLVLDFDFIESGAKAGAPKYMEWYAAFGLLVTLIWLYVEILRILAKARSRKSAFARLGRYE